MIDSVFTKIIKGEIPCHKIFEDEDILVILDINPQSLGHSLIITKEKYETLMDVPDEKLEKILVAAKKLSIHILKELGASGIKIVQNNGNSSGQEVMHYHLHVIPSYKTNKKDIPLNELADKLSKNFSL